MDDKDDWDAHWSEQDVLGKYNPGQIFRHVSVSRLIEDCKEKSVVIDFGSGQGGLINILSERLQNTKFYGLEYSKIGVEISKRNNPNACFEQADLTTKNLSSNYHIRGDIITCCDVLEHIDDPVEVLNNGYDMLKVGGAMIITLPGGPMSQLDHHIGHRFHYDTKRLTKLLESSKFKKFEVRAIGWPFFNLYRVMLLLRGARLIDDVSCAGKKVVPQKIKIVGTIFKYLFKLNVNSLNLGWQMIAIARK
jgi:SAM-dependent methyltransferase